MDDPIQTPGAPARACPECGAAAQADQRRCTNCGASVDARRRLPRRTPLIAAISVVALSAAGVVVAQAAVTEQAGIDASAPADVASAPISVPGAPLPAAKRPTSTKPKPIVVASTPTTPQSTSPLEIPKLDTDVLKAAQEARDAAAAAAAEAKKKADALKNPDGTPNADDGKSNPDDLQNVKKIKVRRVANYDPDLRAGVEFGAPKAAVDKRSRTVWDVNVPADSQPFGVGIVLDLGVQPRRVSSIKISTPTPGFGAVFYRADAAELPDKIDDRWTRAAKVPEVSDGLTVPLTDDGEAKWTRFILVYLTTPRSAEDTRAAISDLEVLP